MLIFFLATAIFQARWLDRGFYLQCSHVDEGLVFSGAIHRASHSRQEETAGVLDLWVVATCSDGTGDTFRCARCRQEKLRLWLMLWDERDTFSSQHHHWTWFDLCLACCSLFPIHPPRLCSLWQELLLLVPCPMLFHCCLGPLITENNNNHNLRNQS